MSDIFYSEVDANLQKELNARAAAGIRNRTTADINYMVSKIANVQITPYATAKRESTIEAAILGGLNVRQGEYLPTGPQGYTNDRKFNVTDEKTGGPVQERTNTSKRIPPYITGVDIQIGDDSLGVMQTANINITVPNPTRDLNYIESVYLRPGRHVTVAIQHPETALLSKDETEGLLTSKVMPSAEAIKKLYPNATQEQIESFKKMNQFLFDGIIISFTLSYQTDASVAVSLVIRGTSAVYTDVSMTMGNAAKQTQKTSPAIDPATGTPIIDTALTSNAAAIANAVSAFTGVSLTDGASAEAIQSFNADVDAAVVAAENRQRNLEFAEIINKAIQEKRDNIDSPGVPSNSTKDKGIFIDPDKANRKDISYIWGEPYAGKPFRSYITLKALIEFINENILVKLQSVTGNSTKIICDREINTSKYYEHLVSADPNNIFFAGQTTYGTRTWYGSVTGNSGTTSFSDKNNKDPKSFPGLMYISLQFIQDTLLLINQTEMNTVNEFLKTLSSKIYYASGGAYQMSLITHPEIQNVLLYYDTNNVKGFKEPVPIPYPVPMFANDVADGVGTIVKDFQFNGKLPSDASTLSYVLNQDPADISESDIAPFLSYMYSANTIERSGPNETIKNIISPETLQKIEADYKGKHEQYVNELTDPISGSIAIYGKDKDESENQKALHTSLRRYIQYPTATIKNTNQLKAPIIPFDASFTIAGINGFRYGDVLKFNGLPDRYTINTVFSIMAINHSVSDKGEWNTKIRCIMRPKID